MNRRETLAAAFLFAAGWPAAAAVPKYRVDLIGGELIGETYLAGVAIGLEPGWKTYWRVPGDAGIPPTFEWQESRNVADVKLSWPAPRRYVDASGETIGYKDGVVFPVEIKPENIDKPVELDLRMFFAICQDVCIPAKAQAALTAGLSSPDVRALDRIRNALLEVPVPATPPRFESANVIEWNGGLMLVLNYANGAEAGVVDVFVESGSSAYFRAPRLDGRRLLLPIDGLKSPDGLRGRQLSLTIIRESEALEQQVTVS